MSDREDPALPGPPPPMPDLAAVSASIDPPSAPAEAPAAEPVPRAAPVHPPFEVAEVPAPSRIPGAPAAGYGRLPTAPVAMTVQGPLEHEPLEWLPDEPPAPRRAVAGRWALGLAIVALAGSFAVAWMLPLGLIAIVVGIVALRRPEARAVAVWAIVLAAVSTLYSTGWLLWAIGVAGP